MDEKLSNTSDVAFPFVKGSCGRNDRVFGIGMVERVGVSERDNAQTADLESLMEAARGTCSPQSMNLCSVLQHEYRKSERKYKKMGQLVM